MLLDHTSGLGARPDGDHQATLLADLTRSFSPEGVYEKHLTFPPGAEPGDELSYSGAGSIASGTLIERLLGQDLASVIEDRFTGPLALDDTSLPASNAPLERAAGPPPRQRDHDRPPREHRQPDLTALKDLPIAVVRELGLT